MVIVIGDGEVVLAHLSDIRVRFRLLFKLFSSEDVVSVGSCRVVSLSIHICVHVSHIIIHICDFIIVGLLGTCSSISSINIIYILHDVVHVNGRTFILCRWACLEPAVFKLNFSDGASS